MDNGAGAHHSLTEWEQAPNLTEAVVEHIPSTERPCTSFHGQPGVLMLNFLLCVRAVQLSCSHISLEKNSLPIKLELTIDFIGSRDYAFAVASAFMRAMKSLFCSKHSCSKQGPSTVIPAFTSLLTPLPPTNGLGSTTPSTTCETDAIVGQSISRGCHSHTPMKASPRGCSMQAPSRSFLHAISVLLFRY